MIQISMESRIFLFHTKQKSYYSRHSLYLLFQKVESYLTKEVSIQWACFYALALKHLGLTLSSFLSHLISKQVFQHIKWYDKLLHGMAWYVLKTTSKATSKTT